jgi:hypothetical protein
MAEFPVMIALVTVPPSGSVYHRLHWAVKRELRTGFAWEFRCNAELCGLRPRAAHDIPRVRLGIRAYRNGRRYDEENFMAGLKPLLDGMRDAGYLRNDSPVWLELEPRPEQLKCGPDSDRVEIDYTELLGDKK